MQNLKQRSLPLIATWCIRDMMEVVPFDETVTCIKTGAAREGQVIMWAYAYHIGDALLDGACSNAGDDLRQYAARHQIKRVFVTHTHEDHYGGCWLLAPRATVFATPSATKELRTPPKYNEFFRLVWGQPEPLKNVEPMPSSFSVKGLRFDVVQLPGHYEQMVGFYEPKRKWLFSADAVPLASRKEIAMPEENVPQMIVTMERILTMDVEVLFDGHRGPVLEPRVHIRARVDYLQALQRRVQELHSEGKSITEIQATLGFQEPWYLPWTERRFGIDYLIRSLVADKTQVVPRTGVRAML
jgi:glyoxylase-like metal-dependent hydrolase (beta-lactamase superfamily II)